MMIKVAHVIVGLNVGGAELMLSRLVKKLSAGGEVRHTVISLTDLGPIGQDLRCSGVDVITIGLKSPLGAFLALLKLRRVLKSLAPDVVQTWMYHADFLGGIAARSVGVRKVYWGVRTTDASKGGSRLTPWLRYVCAFLSKYIPDLVVCAADASRVEHQKVGYDPQKMLVIPNGFDVGDFEFSRESRREVRNELCIGEQEVVVGSVGRFNHVKDQKAFVKIAQGVLDRIPQARFVIIGRGNSMDNLELLGWMRELGIESAFYLLGEREDVQRCIAAIDVFCLHSRTEGFPNVLCEAILMRRLCAAYDVGDARNICDGTENIVVPSGDVQGMVSAICRLIISPPDEAETYAAARKIGSKYSLDSVASAYAEIYC